MAKIMDIIKNKDFKFFVTGGAFFAASHVLNIISQGSTLSYDLPMYVYFFLFGGSLVVALIAYFITKMKDNSLLKFCFSMMHILNIGFTFLLMMDHKIGSGLMILFGYLLCVTSDIILEKTTFKQDIKRRDFPIMLTYLSGQTLTYLGLLFATFGTF